MSLYISTITTLVAYYLKLHGPASSAILPSLTAYLGNKTLYCNLPHMWESETVLDSGFHAADSGTFFSGTWFLDSNRLTCISGFKAQNLGFRNKNYPNSGFHKQKFPRFHGIPYMGWSYIVKNNQWKHVFSTMAVTVFTPLLYFGKAFGESRHWRMN